MSHATPGFQKIPRQDNLFQERVHDAYKARAKLPEPSVCSQCGAVFHQGRWQWLLAPADAHQETCPACHRIHDHYPAGFLYMKGEFFQSHRDEIMHLVHNHEKHERAEHPLKRIMAVEEKEGETLVSTTDIHLARGIGEALHHAYQGELGSHASFLRLRGIFMTGSKQLVFALCLFWGMHSFAHAQQGNGESRGELLYATHCSACHTSEIHWREQKLATDWNSLEAQVRRWQYNIGLGWRNEEITDVAYYLNAAYYGFPASDSKSDLHGKKIEKVLRR